ncbi:MAG: hypothetical protein NT027_09475 [Proteobacteria bacterium]|nr:hypothetical protein [Pseudomonadota bacterium]
MTNITSNLKKNGYPEKRVALPLEKMYEVAHQKGFNFNKALDALDAQGISHEKTTEKVIFFPKMAPSPSTSTNANPFSGNPLGGDQPLSDMMAEAQRVVSSMSPEERQKLMDMFQNMSPEEQAQIFKKAKDLGIG